MRTFFTGFSAAVRAVYLFSSHSLAVTTTMFKGQGLNL